MCSLYEGFRDLAKMGVVVGNGAVNIEGVLRERETDIVFSLFARRVSAELAGR